MDAPDSPYASSPDAAAAAKGSQPPGPPRSPAEDIAAESDDKCEITLRTLQDLKTKLENTSSSKGNNDVQFIENEETTMRHDSDASCNDKRVKSSDASCNDKRVKSSLSVRSKGRPPSKRKESMTDKIVRRLKMKGNKQQMA